MEKTYLTTILDPFNPENKETIEIEPNLSAYSLLKDLEYDIELYEPIVGRNQDIITQDFEIKEGDNIVLCLVPRGGGSARKVWYAVAMIVVAVLTWGASTWVSAAGYGAIAAGVAGAAVAAIGGLLVNALIPLNQGLGVGGIENFQNSSTYGWESSGNSIQQGVSLPVLYGTHKITPPVISRYIETVGDKQYLHVLYALCEGVIDSATDVKINGDPINLFSGVTTDIRIGTNIQTAISDFITTKTDKSIGRKVSFSEYVSTTTDGNTVTSLGVNLLFSRGIWYANDKGGLNELTLKIIVEYKKVGNTLWTVFPDSKFYVDVDKSVIISYEQKTAWVNPGGGEAWYVTKVDDLTKPIYKPVEAYYYKITANTNDQIRRTLKAAVAEGQYEIRVKFWEDPPTGTRYGNDCYFEFMQEGIADVFTYPNTALLAVRALATDQLSGNMPTMTAVITRNGDTAKPFTNPAWACYDLLTNTRYGAGISTDRIEYAEFQKWATFCAERNYQCNIYLDTTLNLRKALDTISQLGRAVIVQFGSRFSCIVERPEALPTQGFLFGMGNIIKDSFKEEFLPLKNRTNIIEVTYFDKETDYDRSLVEITQGNYDLTNEVNKTSLMLLGCTSKEQALKQAKFILNQNRYLTITASFEADIDSIHCRVGDIINIAHDVPEWGVSGRILEITDTGLQLDREVEFEAGKDYYVQITNVNTDEQIYIKVGALSTKNYVKFLDTTDKTKITKFANYSFGIMDRITKQMRVLRISTSAELRRTITTIEYLPEVYLDNVEIVIDEEETLEAIKNLVIDEGMEILQGGSKTYYLTLTWQGWAFAYRIWYRELGSNTWIYVNQTTNTNYKIRNVLTNVIYEVAVGNTLASAVFETYKVLGDNRPPADVIKFLIDPLGENKYNLRWELPERSDDLLGYEIRMFYGLSDNWDNAQKIHEGFLTSSPYGVTLGNVGAVTFFIKSISNNNIYSVNYAKVIYNINGVDIDNLVEETKFDPIWLGEKYAMYVDNGSLVCADSAYFWDVYDWVEPFGLGGWLSPASRLWLENINFWKGNNDKFWDNSFYDGWYIGDFTVEWEGLCYFTVGFNKPINVFYRKLVDGADDDETMWTPFIEPFEALKGKYQIKIKAYSDDDDRAEIYNLSVFIDAPDVIEVLNDVYIPTTGKTLELTKMFRTIKNVLLTIQTDSGTAYQGKVLEKNPLPKIKLFDINGFAAAGTVDIQVRGY
jgi:predicted phage tail protein